MELHPTNPCGWGKGWLGPFYEAIPNCNIYDEYTETNLFNVYAWEEPEELGGKKQKIGEIILDSEMTTSYYGDTQLFFKHTKFEEDIEAHPEWADYVQTWDRLTWNEEQPISDLTPPAQCPFAFLYKLTFEQN
jgi:hypothetical protein